MKDTNAIAREQQRRNAELAAEMREALRPMPPMTRTDGWTGYTWADLAAYAAQCVRDERDRCASRAWIHYMDICKARGLAPSEHEHWNAARAVREA